MLSDPGSRFDFGTLIAYVIPGYILEVIAFCMADSASVFVAKTFFLSKITWSAIEVAIAGAALTILSYALGLLLDMIAHPITLQNELRFKDLAYKMAVSQFRGFIKDKEINNLLHASDGNSADLTRRDLFIDSMFYRLATPEIWARQNWHWAFYESSRQIYLLCIPFIAATAFYATAAVMLISFSTMAPLLFWGIPSGVAIVAIVVGWFGIKPLMKKASDTNCMVYYRHRAWVLFAYLTERDLFKISSPNEENETTNK